jgi:hypothetical protein
MTKTCTNCGAERPLAEFNRLAKAPDGRAFECRVCAGRRYALRGAQERRRNSPRPGNRGQQRLGREKPGEYLRCLLASVVYGPRVCCGCLVAPAKATEHLRDVHGIADATEHAGYFESVKSSTEAA